MSTTTLVDTIIRGAAVDMFHSQGIAVAPVVPGYRREDLEVPEAAAFLDFHAPQFSGTLYLCCPVGLVPDIGSADRKVTVEDWVRELVNQLLGRIKKRLLQSRVNLRSGLPKTGNAELIRRHFSRVSDRKLYEFRTLKGSVVVLIEGNLSDSVVNYAGEAAVADEGDVILFESEAPGVR